MYFRCNDFSRCFSTSNHSFIIFFTPASAAIMHLSHFTYNTIILLHNDNTIRKPIEWSGLFYISSKCSYLCNGVIHFTYSYISLYKMQEFTEYFKVIVVGVGFSDSVTERLIQDLADAFFIQKEEKTFERQIT